MTKPIRRSGLAMMPHMVRVRPQRAWRKQHNSYGASRPIHVTDRCIRSDGLSADGGIRRPGEPPPYDRSRLVTARQTGHSLDLLRWATTAHLMVLFAKSD